MIVGGLRTEVRWLRGQASETTASRGLMLPMFAGAFIADAASQWVCRAKLYHSLSKTFAVTQTPASA